MEATNTAKFFKPDDIKVTLGDKEYRIVYDLNAFCELEKKYGSLDTILDLVLGKPSDVTVTVRMPSDDGQITLHDNFDTNNIVVGTTPLTALLPRLTEAKQSTLSDTLELLYAGLMHDTAIYNQHDEITGYSITKARIGSRVTLNNVREINSQIALALLRDLIPAQSDESKNVEAPKPTAE